MFMLFSAVVGFAFLHDCATFVLQNTCKFITWCWVELAHDCILSGAGGGHQLYVCEASVNVAADGNF